MRFNTELSKILLSLLCEIASPPNSPLKSWRVAPLGLSHAPHSVRRNGVPEALAEGVGCFESNLAPPATPAQIPPASAGGGSAQAETGDVKWL